VRSVLSPAAHGEKKAKPIKKSRPRAFVPDAAALAAI